MGRKALSLEIGQEFEFAVVIGESVLGQSGRKEYLFRCKLCGTEFRTRAKRILTGHTRSCGCLQSKVTTNRNFKHGESQTIMHVRWRSMNSRCNNSNTRNWDDYGGRGIKICAGWSGDEGFIAWKNDMGMLPSEKHSIDRIDVDGNYSCGKCDECIKNGWEMNCRWALQKEQQRNKRNTRLREAFGCKKTIAEWSELSGIHPSLLWARLDEFMNWSLERALATPDPRGNYLKEINGLKVEMIKPLRNYKLKIKEVLSASKKSERMAWSSHSQSFRVDERPSVQ